MEHPLSLTPTQDTALQSIRSWYKQCHEEKRNAHKLNKPFFYLAGYAGTGKTTLVGIFRDYISGKVCYAAYTGKAAMQMRKQGVAAQTVHSLCYIPQVDKEGKTTFALNPDCELSYAKLLVLDECSMVGKEMGADLLSFETPILVLGDPGQLPPIKGTAFFTGKTPDIMLEEVHRQALDSPILRVATEVRQGKTLKRTDEEGLLVYPMLGDGDKEDILLNCEQAITGTNKVRNRGNKIVREHYDCPGPFPITNERLVCLRNNRRFGLFNGLIVQTLSDAKENGEEIKLNIRTELGTELKSIRILKECFSNYKAVQELPYNQRALYDEFDYGYVLTVHKSQGSQWDDVLLLDDGFLRWDRGQRKRWLYTAITRAAEKLTIIRA